MSRSFSTSVSWMMESSNWIEISPYSGTRSPIACADASTAYDTSTIGRCRPISCFLTFLMSAELSGETSVAVRTYPTLSMSELSIP